MIHFNRSPPPTSGNLLCRKPEALKHWVIRSEWREARRKSPRHGVTFASQTYWILTKGLYHRWGNWVTENQQSGLQRSMLSTDPTGNQVGGRNQGQEFQRPGGSSSQGPAWRTRIPWEPGDPTEDPGLLYGPRVYSHSTSLTSALSLIKQPTTSPLMQINEVLLQVFLIPLGVKLKPNK